MQNKKETHQTQLCFYLENPLSKILLQLMQHNPYLSSSNLILQLIDFIKFFY